MHIPRRHPVGFEDLPLRRSAQGQQPSHRYLYVPVLNVRAKAGQLTPPTRTDVCYKPAAWCTPEAVAERRYARENMRNTVHDPCYPDMVDNSPPTRDGKPDPAWAKMQVPPNKPVFNELGRKLHGVESY
jgi:hypothetical protein